jgi:hypothetical protein
MTLGCQSIEAVHLNLKIRRLEIQQYRATAELMRAGGLRGVNASLWTRWVDDRLSYSEQLKPLYEHARDASRAIPPDRPELRAQGKAAYDRGQWELEQLRRRDPNFVSRKQQLEIDILRTEQCYEECISALHSADQSRIAAVFENYRTVRESSLTSLDAFEADYLTVTAAPDDGPWIDFQPLPPPSPTDEPG